MNRLPTAADEPRIDRFFALPENRTDAWLDFERTTRTWAGEPGSASAAAACAAALDALLPLETFFAYPGARLLATLRERVAGGDAHGTARLVRRISLAMMRHAYRRDPSEWDPDEDAAPPASVMPTVASDTA